MAVILVAGVAGLTTLALVPLLAPALERLGAVDVPGPRSSHVRPTPRGGGVALVGGLLLAAVVASATGHAVEPAYALGLVGLAAVGLAEDLHGLSVRDRLVLQGVVAGLSVSMVLGVASSPSTVLALVGAGLLVLGCANAFNFMDGINGISGLSAAVAGVWFATGTGGGDVLDVLGVSLAAAALGFLPWNAPRARVFLGDVGSYTLGFAVAFAALVALQEGVAPPMAVAPLVLYGSDTAWTLLRRVRGGRTWHQAHREHVYQRLIDEGASHTTVAVFVALLSAAICAASLLPGPWPVAVSAMGVLALGYLGSVGLVRLLRPRQLEPGNRLGRVLHVAAVDFTATRLLLPQLNDLARAGYDVRLACGRTDDHDWDTLRAFEPLDLRFPRSLNPLRMAVATWHLGRFVWRWRPDVLHLHTPAAGLPVRLVPRFLWPRGLRIVYTVHGYLHPWPPATRRDRLVQRLERFLSRRTDLTLFQSREDLAEALAREYGGAPTLLGNGVEDAWFEIPDRRRPDGQDLALLFVGRLVREKGILDLLEAVARTPGVRLHVAGDALPSDRDPVAREVAALARDSRLEGRVVLHGMVAKPALGALYEQVDVLCLPSYREGVPRSVIEAMAAGRPAIASRIRGCRELVEDRRSGLLHEPGDVDGLARALATAAGQPRERLAEMGRAARATADPGLRESVVLQRLRDGYAMLGCHGAEVAPRTDRAKEGSVEP